MRIVHVMKAVGLAGAERHLLMLASGLHQQGIDTHIVLLVEPKKPMDDFARAADERAIPLQREIIKSDVDVTLTRRLRDVFLDLKPDVVHTHLLHADLFGIPAARMARVPVILTSRHNDNNFRRRLPIRLVNNGLWRTADAGICISDAIRRFSIKVEGAPPDKLRIIYYGLDVQPDDAKRQAMRAAFRQELGVSPATPLAGMVCRLVPQKGVRYGLEAFGQVAPHFPDAHLVVAGDGALRKSLESEASALGCADRVHFLGWREDGLKVLAGLDVLLMPSLWEGFGLVMLEAMSQRIPIIGSRVSAIPEVIADGETGLLVPPRDVDALANALSLLLGDYPLRQHMGLMGEERLEERFTAAQMIAETIALYEQLLARRKRS